MFILTPDVVFTILDQIKWWAGILGAVVFGAKIVNWFKDIRAKDLKDIHAGVNETQQELIKQTDILQKGFQNIVTSSSRDIQELRSDFRTFFTFSSPAMAPAHKAPARKLRKTVAKSGRPTPKKSKLRGKTTKTR